MTEKKAQTMAPRTLIRIVLTALVVLASPLLTESGAQASHYDLVDVDLVPAEVRTTLAEVGVIDTKQLLERMVSVEGRADFALLSGSDEESVMLLARTLELMQVVGIGPKAARLLMAAGVVSVSDLAGRSAGELLPLLVSANAAKQITGVDPDEAVVVDWIERAGKASVILVEAGAAQK